MSLALANFLKNISIIAAVSFGPSKYMLNIIAEKNSNDIYELI
jgi:hypothetical protein